MNCHVLPSKLDPTYRGGANIRYVQALLGHADIRTTQIYTALAPKDPETAYRRYHPRDSMKIERAT